MRLIAFICAIILFIDPVFSGESKIFIYTLSVSDNKTRVGIEISDYPDEEYIDQILSKIKSNEKIELIDNQNWPSRKKALIYISSKKSMPINEMENILTGLGFSQVFYKGKMINADNLSDNYEPPNIYGDHIEIKKNDK